ncbi:site-specific integrase [Streptosporangium pseudovulgare]|uniref:site-specific integrase n=1 Tax=Streptosporangium pseudovulgare TaxID=35765 RepID=UPI0016707085|nr:site-specific integrase [Streptosporangium pseudovulgare]
MTVAKAYRLLKAILSTAVDDQLIKRNPCRIKGAGQERSPERPVLTVAEVYKLADAIEPRYRALVLLATFGSLRWGELAGLQCRDIDLDAGTVRVERQLMQITGKGLVFTEPKSAAGKRTVVIPELIVKDLREHVKYFAQDGEKGLIFAGPDDGPLRNTNFNRRVWPQVLQDTDLPKIHFHDLRHTGQHPRRERRGVDPGADGAHGSLQHAGRDDLSALDPRAAAAGGPQARRPRPRGTRRDIGHATGTGAGQGRMKIEAQVRRPCLTWASSCREGGGA